MKGLSSFVGRLVLGAAVVVGGLSPAFAEESITSKVLTLVSKLSPEQQQALYDLLTKMTAGGGAAAAASTAPTPEKSLNDGIGKVKEAAVKGDVAGMMAVVSKDFQQSQIGGKDGLESAIQGLMATGQLQEYAKDTEISIAKATVKVENGTATVYPVDVTGPWGTATLSLTAKLEGDAWKVVGAEIY